MPNNYVVQMSKGNGTPFLIMDEEARAAVTAEATARANAVSDEATARENEIKKLDDKNQMSIDAISKAAVDFTNQDRDVLLTGDNVKLLYNTLLRNVDGTLVQSANNARASILPFCGVTSGTMKIVPEDGFDYIVFVVNSDWEVLSSTGWVANGAAKMIECTPQTMFAVTTRKHDESDFVGTEIPVFINSYRAAMPCTTAFENTQEPESNITDAVVIGPKTKISVSTHTGWEATSNIDETFPVEPGDYVYINVGEKTLFGNGYLGRYYFFDATDNELNNVRIPETSADPDTGEYHQKIVAPNNAASCRVLIYGFTNYATEVGVTCVIRDVMIIRGRQPEPKNYSRKILWDDVAQKGLAKWIPISGGNEQYTSGVKSGSLYPRLSLLWMSDNHIDMSNEKYSLENHMKAVEMANETQKYKDDIGNKYGISAIVDCGDAITNSGTKASILPTFNRYFAQAKKAKVPYLFSIGNHDTNNWGSDGTVDYITDADWSDLIFDYEETEFGIVRQTKANGEKSTWYFYDIPAFKVRIIVADAQDTDKTKKDDNDEALYNGSKAWAIGQEQMDWIANTALNFTSKAEKDWGVVMVLHQGYEYGSASGITPPIESSIAKLLNICEAFNTQQSIHVEYSYPTDTWYDLDVEADYTGYTGAKKPHMICWLLGHIHIDKQEVVQGINIITTGNNSCQTEFSSPYLPRIPNTPTQMLFNIVTIDTKTRKIRIARIGADKDVFGHSLDVAIDDGISY